jgi:serine/threonine protein kinase
MSLTPGTRFGSFEITSLLGEGGMGAVYRGRDTRLDRDVAIKVLLDSFAHDADRLARFEREAKLLASLNHPHIAQIYGLEVSDSSSALVMELVDGPTLADRIAQGPLPLDEALAIARQMTDALEAAHEQAIVHRDLKPANIKLRPDGTVKVLDFGLAKAMDPSLSSGSDPMMSPTLTTHATQIGAVLGTAAYMAPEQARGRAVDKRADIWAFGVILDEMLTGRSPFASESVPDTLAQVLTRDVDLSALPARTPRRLRTLISRCLVKDPKQRLRDIGDVRLMLDEKDDEALSTTATVAAPRRSSRALVALIGVAILVVAAAILASSFLRQEQTEPPLIRLSITLPPGEQVTTVPAISPDGTTIAYAAGRSASSSKLYLRRLDSFDARAVDSGRGALLPFFSPDGRSLGFFAAGKIWRVPVAGGTPVSLASAPKPWGATWAADGTIVYVPNLNAGLWRVPERGGTPEQLTEPDDAEGGYAHTYPQRMPGTDEIFFSFWGKTFHAAVFSPKTKTIRKVTRYQTSNGAAAIGIYAENGYLLTGDSADGVTAVAWNPSVATANSGDTVVIGDAYRVLGQERIWMNVSASGTAVYAPGSQGRRHLVWVDRNGGVTRVPGDADAIIQDVLSRDGTRILRQARTSEWVDDLKTGTRTRVITDRLTFHGGWLPGDERVVISSNEDGNWDLYTVGARGSGELKLLLKKPFTQHPLAVAPDGSVVFLESHPKTGNDLWVLTPDGHPRPLLVTAFNETGAAVSPDGKYVAYQSDESGQNEVYAIPFSASDATDRVTVSVGGGTGPVWSRDGRELFYRAGDDLMSAEIQSMTPLTLGTRRKLLDVSGFEPGYFHEFDVSADGQRFLFIQAEPDARPTRLDVIVNWFPELARLVKK